MLTNNLEEKISTVSEEKIKALQERGRAILEARRKNAQPALYTSMTASMQEQHKTQPEQLQPSKVQTLHSLQTDLESSTLSTQALSNTKQMDELQPAKSMPTTTTPLVNARHQESNAMQESTLSSADMIPKVEVEKMRTELVDKFNEHLAKCESDNKLYWEQVAATHAEDIAAIEAERDEYKALCEQLKTTQLETDTESRHTIDELNKENAKILKELEEAKTVNNELLTEIARAKRELQGQNIELEDARSKLLMLTETQIDKSFANLVNDEAWERKVAELSLELQITITMNELEKQMTNIIKSKCEDMEKIWQKRIDELSIQLQETKSTLDESESIRKILEDDAAELQHIVDEEQATNRKLQEEIEDLHSRLYEMEQTVAGNAHNTNTTTIHSDNIDPAVNEFNPFYESTNEFDTLNEEQGTQYHIDDVAVAVVDHHHHVNDNINVLTNEEQGKLVKYETVSNPFADDDDDNDGNDNNDIDFATINESGQMRVDTMRENDEGNDQIDEYHVADNNRKEEENDVFTELQNEANNKENNNDDVDKFDMEERQMLYREIEMLRSELEESMQQLQIANDEVQRLNEELYCVCNTNKELTKEQQQQQQEEEHKEVMIDDVCNEAVNTENTCTLHQINAIDMEQVHINDNITYDEFTDEKDNANDNIVPISTEKVYELPESTNYNDDQAVEADNPFLDEDDSHVLPLQTNKVIEAGEGALESDELTWKENRIEYLENELESVLAQHEEEMQALADEAADRMIEVKEDYENEINELKLLVNHLQQQEQEVEEPKQVEVGQLEHAENVEADNIVNEETEDGLAANHNTENEVNEQITSLTAQNEQLTMEINELHQQLQTLHDEHNLEIENMLIESEERERKYEADMEQLLQEQERKYKELLERELAEMVDKADYLQLEEEALEVQDKYEALLHEYEVLENIQRTTCTVKDSEENAHEHTATSDENNNNTEKDNNEMYLGNSQEHNDDSSNVVNKDKSNNNGDDAVIQQEAHIREEMWQLEKAKLERELCEVKQQLQLLKEKEQEEYNNNNKVQVAKAKEHEPAERKIKELQEHNNELEELVRVGAIKIESALEEQNRQQMKLQEELCQKEEKTKTLQLHIAQLQEELQTAKDNLLAMKRNEEETTLHEMNELQEQMTLLQTELQDQRTNTGMAERAMREKVLLYDELVKEKTRLLQRHEAETLTLRNELLTVRSELHSLQSHAATFPVTEEHYKTEIAELTQRLKQQNAECQSLQEELNECKRVITEHEKLEEENQVKIKQQQNEATAHEKVKLSEEGRKEEGGVNEITQHDQTSWSTCEGQIDRLLERNSHLEEQLKELHITHNNLLDEHNALQVELLQARRGIELKEQTLKRSESELRHCRAQLSHYTESMTTKSNQLQSIEMELEEYKHHRGELLDEIDTISRRLLFQEEMYEQSSFCELLWEEKVYSVASHLDEWITAVYGGYELLQTTLAAQHKTILHKCDAIESAAAQALTEGEAQIAEYEEALESAAQEQKEMHDMITDLTAQLAQLKNKEASQHEELNEVQRQMEDAMQHHKKEMKELKKLLSEAENKYENEAHACLLAKEEMEHMRHQAEMSANAWHVQHDELNRQIQLLQTQIASQQDNVSTIKENEWATQSKLQSELSLALDERTRAMASVQSLQAQLDKLLPRLQEMEKHEAQRSAELMDLKQSLSLTSIELAKEKTAHSREVSSLQELLEQHKQDLHTLQEDYATLSISRDKFSAQTSELTLKLSSAHAQLASQEQIIEQLRLSLSEAQSVINRQTSECELRQNTTERELKHFEHMYAASKTQLEELNAQLAELQSSCAAAQDTLKRTHIEFNQREEQYKREQTQLQTENERLVHKVETLETQNDAHRTARLDAEEKLHSTLEKLHQLGEELHESHAHMNNMNTTLTQRTSTYSAEVEEMKAALHRAQVEVAESRKLLSAAEVQQVEKDGMLFRIKGELTAVRNELAQCQSTIITLEERREAAELRAQKCTHTQEQEHQEHHLETRKLEANIAQLESDRILREEALHTCRSSLNELTEQLRVVQLELQNVKDAHVVQREQFRRERIELHDRLAECTDSKEELERELELMKKATETKLHVCTTSERALQCEVADLKADLAQLQREHDQLQHVKQTFEALAERLQNNVSSQETHIHELEQELTYAVKEKNSFASQLRELQRKMESVTNEFTEQLKDERERATLEKERWLHQYKFAIEKEQSLLAEARAGRETALARLASAQNDLQSNEAQIRRMQQEWRHALRSEQELHQWLNMIEQFAMQAANEIGYECIPPPLQSSTRVEDLSHEQEISPSSSSVEITELSSNPYNDNNDNDNNKTPANKERQLMVVHNTCPFTIDVGAVFEALLDRLQIFTLSAHSMEVEDRQLDELYSALTQLQTHVDDMNVMCNNVNSNNYSDNNTSTLSKAHNTHELFAESELQVLSEQEEEEEEEESLSGFMQNKMSNSENRKNVSSHMQTPQLPSHPHHYRHDSIQYNKLEGSNKYNSNNIKHSKKARHHSDMQAMLLNTSHVQFLQFIVTCARTYIHRVLDHIHTMEEELRTVVFAMGMHHLSNTATTNINTSKGNKHSMNNNNQYEIKSALTVDSLVTRQRLQVTNTIAFLHKRTAELTRLIQRIVQYYSSALTSEQQEQQHLQGRKKNVMSSNNNNSANYKRNPSATPSSTSVRSSAASSTTSTSNYNTSTQHKQEQLEEEQEREQEEFQVSENNRHIPLRRKLGHLMMKSSTLNASPAKPYLTNETSHGSNNNSKTGNNVNENREAILKKWTSLLQATWQVFAEAERLALRPYNELLVDCITSTKTQAEEIQKQRSKQNTFVQNEKVVDKNNTEHVTKLDDERERQYRENAEKNKEEEHYLDNTNNEERNSKY